MKPPTSRATLASVITINPEVAYRELGDEMVILNLETGIYFGLDAVGARTWRLIEDYGALDTVLAALHSEYDAPPSVLERDLLALVDQLCQKGLTRVVANAT